MEEKKLNDITSNIMKKLGDEKSALILDDIGLLITENNTTLKEINALKNEKSDLEKKYNSIMEVNGKLLQQIPIGFDREEKEEEKKEEKKPFSFSSMFDEKGNFKHTM